jgi:hypothetical protein
MTLQILSDILLDPFEEDTMTQENRVLFETCIAQINHIKQTSPLRFCTEFSLCYQNYFIGHHNGVPGLVMYISSYHTPPAHENFKLFEEIKRISKRSDLIFEVHPEGTRADLGLYHTLLVFVPHISSFTQEFEDMFTPLLSKYI